MTIKIGKLDSFPVQWFNSIRDKAISHICTYSNKKLD